MLHAVANLYTGGSARLVVDLVEHLEDFEHATVVRTAPPEPHYVGLELEEIPAIASVRAGRALLRRLRPDLLHVHYLGHERDRYGRADREWYEPLFAAAAEDGYPVVENINIPVPPYVSDSVARYVFVSDYVRRQFGADVHASVTIYPGSNLHLFSRPDGAAAPNRCVGMVYRLEADKLDETAIEVFVEIVRRRPGTKVVIVGGGRFLEPYRARVREAGMDHAFEFTAYVAYDDLPALYGRMSVFVAPPHSESFGHVVPLAMGMAIPVAAYDVGALAEILGSRRTLAPAGDARALAAKAVELLDDDELRRRIGAENRERARRLFSVEKMAADYRGLYRELLG